LFQFMLNKIEHITMTVMKWIDFLGVNDNII